MCSVTIDKKQILEYTTKRLSTLEENLSKIDLIQDLKLRREATDILQSLQTNNTLSHRQWDYLEFIFSTVTNPINLFGDFKAILVMFRIASSHKIKYPRIRLCISSPGETDFNYFELWAFPLGHDKYGRAKDPNTLELYLGGWQGSGRRRFGGWLTHSELRPYRADLITPEIIDLLREFASDPQRVAKAVSLKLSACMYCGQTLSDAESKKRGYGPICAEHYHLPWGAETTKSREQKFALRRLLGAV